MYTAKIINLKKASENVNPAIVQHNTTAVQSEGLKRELGVIDIATSVVNMTIARVG